MTSESDEPTAAELAESMRAALRNARWDPEGDPGVAITVLADMVEGVCGPVDTLAVGRTVFESEALAAAYIFCASVRKAIDPNHRAKPPEIHGISHEEHLSHVRSVLPRFSEQRQESLALINQEFPELCCP